MTSAVESMRIRFVTPPKAKQVGGIENAVEGLREVLQQRGVAVMDGGDVNDLSAIHHFHGLWNLSSSRLASRLQKYNLPYVVSPHGMLEPWAFRHRLWKKFPYFCAIERRFLKEAKAIFVTSAMEAAHLSRILSHPRIEILPIGCRDSHGPNYNAARNALHWPAKDRVVLFLSRIDVKKGLDILINALSTSRKDWNGWRLVVVGDGDSAYISSLKRMAGAASAYLPKIDWVGPVWGAARWQYIQGADLFCLPTHSENFGIAVLEALHAGTPVLTTDRTPWAEFTDLNGLFIAKPEARNIQEILSVAQRTVMNSWSLHDRARLASWAEEHFSWRRLVAEYIRTYQAVND